MDKSIDILSDEILKTAGFGSAIGRTLGAATLGAGIGATKGVSANEANPNATADEKATNVLGGAAGGALAAGAIAGPGVGAAKHFGKKALNTVSNLGSKALNMFKHSEMEVPNDIDKSIDEDENVRESPNELEKRMMINSITEKDELKQKYKDLIEKKALDFCKEANYLKDIKCEQCGYEGVPHSSDGRCPECGALGGVKPRSHSHSNTNDAPLNRELMEGQLQQAAEQSRRDSFFYY